LRHGATARAPDSGDFHLARSVYWWSAMSRRTREPRFDAVPEVLAFVAHVLLIAVILWSMGYLS
jgi:hypothetical protein